MGVFKMFSSSSNDKEIRYVDREVIKNLPNPNPNNYKILQHKKIGNYLIIKINYLDCTNYEGNKILVFENCRLDELLYQKSIDPHFSENKKFKSPIARFKPTEKGWKLAELMCKL